MTNTNTEPIRLPANVDADLLVSGLAEMLAGGQCKVTGSDGSRSCGWCHFTVTFSAPGQAVRWTVSKRMITRFAVIERGGGKVIRHALGVFDEQVPQWVLRMLKNAKTACNRNNNGAHMNSPKNNMQDVQRLMAIFAISEMSAAERCALRKKSRQITNRTGTTFVDAMIVVAARSMIDLDDPDQPIFWN